MSKTILSMLSTGWFQELIKCYETCRIATFALKLKYIKIKSNQMKQESLIDNAYDVNLF